MFTSDRNCPLRVIPTTEETQQVQGTETYVALYYQHEKEHYDALIPSSKEPKENRQEGTEILLFKRLEHLNLKLGASKPVKNVFYAASEWLIKCPVEAPDMLESVVTLYLKTHGLTENGNGEQSLADDSVKIKALADLLESTVVLVSNQKSRALSLVSPTEKAQQILYRRVVFCASFTHPGAVDYYPVEPSEDAHLGENIWRRGKHTPGLLETRLKRMGLEKWNHSGTDMFTAIADQAPKTTTDNLKQAVVQELTSDHERYQSKSFCDEEDWNKCKGLFLSDLTISDAFVDTVARVTATVLETNILIVLSSPSCPFYLVSPLTKPTNKLLYLGKMQHGQTGIYFPLSLISSGANKRHDKLRRSERSSHSSGSEDSVQQIFHKPVNGNSRKSSRSSNHTLDANRLRQKVCAHFEKHAITYQKKYGLSGKDWYKELETLSKPGCWDVSLADFVPEALATVIGRRVVILFEDQTMEQQEFNPDGPVTQDTPIYLVRQPDHFHAAVEAVADDAQNIDDQDMQSDRELRIMLAEKDLTLVPIQRDGNCMFEAVAVQL
ncbi:unnamed protein product [Lymnaea stagnalis]|uniref:OTU domain-containing protein n=1 Tax=Lymnaea stagnalis TaxID=6523 RepID=A0AAV2HZ49_LYMST